MKIQINKPLKNYKAGYIIDIKDKNGIPTDIYWFRRLKDAKIDNCIEIIKSSSFKKSKKIEE